MAPWLQHTMTSLPRAYLSFLEDLQAHAPGWTVPLAGMAPSSPVFFALSAVRRLQQFVPTVPCWFGPSFLRPRGPRRIAECHGRGTGCCHYRVVQAGAHVLNMSAALARPSARGERSVEEALHYAASRGVLAVAAAGNQGSIGSSAITRHPWVIPVAGCDGDGTPTHETNLGSSIAKRGLRAPARDVTSLGADGNPQSFDGTSAATPFVTGAIALLLSEFPNASAAHIKWSVTRAGDSVRRAIVPPLLDAWTSYRMMAGT